MRTTLKYFISAGILLTIFLITTYKTSSQNILQQAKQMFQNYEYQNAIGLYSEYFSSNPIIVDDARNLAFCYLMVNNQSLATEWMGKVVESGKALPSDVLKYADLLKTEGKYDEAIAQYKAYKNLNAADAISVDHLIDACFQSKKWIEKPVYFDVSPAQVFNTSYSEFGLIPFDKGYIVTSERKLEGNKYSGNELYDATENPYYKMYYITTDQDLSKLKSINSIEVINNKYHNGPCVFNKSEQKLFFTRTKQVKVPQKPVNPDPTNWFDLTKASDVVNRLEIYTAQYNNGNWSNIQPLPYNKPEEYSVGHPALSPDGSILYFVSDMPGGYGETDIYFCEKNGQGWSAPVNAGNIINTSGKEMFPYVDSDGMLYFSSTGHQGLGGLDIFFTKGNKDNWTKPENIKFPLNSSRDDFSICFTENGKSGFLASNRAGGSMSDDIYMFNENPPKELIIAITTKEKTENNTFKMLPGVDVEIIISDLSKSKKFTTNTTGKLFFTADCNISYEIKGKKDGYLSQSKNITTACITKNDTLFVDLNFDKLVIDKPIVLYDIYYDFDRWNIRPDAAGDLDHLTMIMKENLDILVELSSHTDSRGTNEYNQELSQKRAESAVNYIISQGIDPKRISAKGYGETQLVNKCSDDIICSEEDHQMNRRTEFKVTGKDKSIKAKSQPKKLIGSTTKNITNKADEVNYHLIEPGETLYSISVKFKTTIEKLKALNGLSDNFIVAGQKIKVK